MSRKVNLPPALRFAKLPNLLPELDADFCCHPSSIWLSSLQNFK
jgi:hypothetical protein